MKEKEIQCMYCSMMTADASHVCDECKDAGEELAEKLEGKWNENC